MTPASPFAAAQPSTSGQSGSSGPLVSPMRSPTSGGGTAGSPFTAAPPAAPSAGAGMGGSGPAVSPMRPPTQPGGGMSQWLSMLRRLVPRGGQSGAGGSGLAKYGYTPGQAPQDYRSFPNPVRTPGVPGSSPPPAPAAPQPDPGVSVRGKNPMTTPDQIYRANSGEWAP